MQLLELQQRFAFFVSELIKYIYEKSYAVTFAETYRPPELANLYAKQGRGIKNSLHCDRLAIDINLFKNKTWLKGRTDFEQFGKFWEGLSSPDCQCVWGGSWGGDLNHFSVSYMNRK